MTPRVEVLQLDAATLRALADGDLAAADRTAPVPLMASMTVADTCGTWPTFNVAGPDAGW